jgi:glutathione S-transferase
MQAVHAVHGAAESLKAQAEASAHALKDKVLGTRPLLTHAMPREYGVVILVFLLSAGVLLYLAACVDRARRKYDVPAPIMYTTDEKKLKFNQIQRGHQHNLENYPQFAIMLLLSGIEHPIIASIAGLVYCLGMVAYAWGYQQGVAGYRYGFMKVPAYFGLMFITAKLALYQLKMWGSGPLGSVL